MDDGAESTTKLRFEDCFHRPQVIHLCLICSVSELVVHSSDNQDPLLAGVRRLEKMIIYSDYHRQDFTYRLKAVVKV
jgi:hypothetical protein